MPDILRDILSNYVSGSCQLNTHLPHFNAEESRKIRKAKTGTIKASYLLVYIRQGYLSELDWRDRDAS